MGEAFGETFSREASTTRPGKLPGGVGLDVGVCGWFAEGPLVAKSDLTTANSGCVLTYMHPCVSFSPGKKYSYHTHFLGKSGEAPRGEIICPKSFSC